MAAIALETVNIVVNDVEIAVPKGELIVEAVKRLGLEIPIFCYHPRMKPVGMCRMCLVEIGFKQPDGSVRKMPKPQAACTLPASEGMVVFTDTEMVHRDRKGVLEFLLINHPLDCPICDRGGECPLQNNTLFYGPATSRFIESKRHAHKAFPLSKHVTLDLERCIQCGRCVRFTEEISGDAELAFRFRGAAMQPSTFELRDFTSKFSGNVIEICPVGALTNRNYRFRARPWDLQTRPSVCTVCSNGCNIWFDYRVNKMVRINGRTNEAINEEWTCDRGKFGHEFYNSEARLTKPLIRKGDRLVECDWPTAYAAILAAFSVGGNKVAALGGGTISNEGVHLLGRLFREKFGSENLDYRWTKHLPAPGFKSASSIVSLESKSGILIFGTSLAEDEPIVFLRVRKGWFNNATRVVVAHDSNTEVDSFAHLILRYKPGTGAALAAGLQAAAKGESVDSVAETTGVSADKIREAATYLGANSAIITTYSLFNQPKASESLASLTALASATGSEFNCYGLQANDQGCEEQGFLPGASGLGTHEILQGCIGGTVEALWLADANPLELHFDRAFAQRALENVPFLVIQAVSSSELTHYASVVLPLAAPAEAEGSYTNVDGQVQWLDPVIPAPGEAKAAWRIGSELVVRAGLGRPAFSAREVLAP